eukprot:scaffold2491_cov145-Skeletonema_menzelii.AAC.1
MIPRAGAVTPIKIKIEEVVKPQAQAQGALRRHDFGQTVNNGSGSDDQPNKRHKTNGMQATLLNEFDQEFGDVESLFLPSRSRSHQERISEVRPGIDRLFLPFEEARRLRIPEVIWIHSNFPGFQKCPLNIPHHQDKEEELLPKANNNNAPYDVTERMRQEKEMS